VILHIPRALKFVIQTVPWFLNHRHLEEWLFIAFRLQLTISSHSLTKANVSFHWCVWWICWTLYITACLWNKRSWPNRRTLLLLLLEWLYSPCGPSPILQFPDLIYSQSAGLPEWVISSSQGLYRNFGREMADNFALRPPWGLRFFNVQ
jgi:hypothetical protein